MPVAAPFGRRPACRRRLPPQGRITGAQLRPPRIRQSSVGRHSCSTCDIQKPAAAITATTASAIRALRRDGGSSSMALALTPVTGLRRSVEPMRRAGNANRLVCLLGWPPCCAGAARAADRYFETSDGVRLHYVEAGRGRTIVMVPGWTMPAWIFDRADPRVFHATTASWRSIPARRATARSPPAATTRAARPGHRRAARPARPRAGGADGLVARRAGQPGLCQRATATRRLAGLVLVDNSVGEEPAADRLRRVRARPGPKLSREEQMRRFVGGMFARPQPRS